MKTVLRYVSFVFLGFALTAPAATVSRAASQDEHHDKRVYDRSHKDYHNWDEHEDRAYHQYFTENHREYREYGKLNRKDQEAYWGWRHDHPDDRH